MMRGEVGRSGLEIGGVGVRIMAALQTIISQSLSRVGEFTQNVGSG